MKIKKYQEGTQQDGIQYSKIQTTKNRPYNTEYLKYIDNFLNKRFNDSVLRKIILGNIIEESGGNPFAKSDTGKYYGILQWDNSRYKYNKETDPYKELDNQLNYLSNTIDNTSDQVSWTHGGTGSGYKTAKDAIDTFNNPNNTVYDRHKAFSFGYVRPAGKLNSVNNRYKVIDQLLSPFEQYLNTLPVNQRDTTGFNARRYWELNGEPRNFEEARDKGMFVWDDSDNGWHASSMAHNFNTGVDEIMKSPNHPTYWMNDVGTLLYKDYIMNHRKQNNAWYPYPYIPAMYTRSLEQNLGPTYIKQ